MSSLRVPAAAALMAFAATVAAAEEVSIRAGGQTGKGFTLSAGNDCLVVTPKHVVTREDGGVARIIEVRGSLSTQSEATVVRRHPDADLALLSLKAPEAVRCAEQEFAALPPSLQAVTRLESGIVKFFDVVLEGENPPEIFVRSELEVTKGYSGSSLYLNGERIGQMYGLDHRNGMIRVYTLDYIYTALNIGQLRPMDVETAQSVLDRAIENRDGSAQGQNIAISALNAQGYKFSGVDMSGVNLDGAVLANGDMSDARLHFVSLADANASKLDLSGSGLRFGNVSRANLAQADLTGVFAPFLDATEVQSPNAKMTGANFFLGDFRGANLRGADLSEATFAFADLTGADLRGANLTNSYFVGAVMDNVLLGGAIFENTNLLAAVLDPKLLAAEQAKGACRHSGDTRGGFDVRLMERWPSDRYDSGYQFEDLFEYTRLPWVTGLDDTSLPICASSDDLAVGWHAYSPTNIGVHLDREYLARAGRAEKAKARVISAIGRAQESREKNGIFQGSKGYIDDWIATIESAATTGEISGKAFADTDLVSLLLMKNGIIKPDDEFWQTLLRERHRFENSIRNKEDEDFETSTAWGPIFPENAPYEEVKDLAMRPFQSWTERRLENLGTDMIVRAAGCVHEGPDDQTSTFSFATGYLATMPEGTYFPEQATWSSSAAARAIEGKLTTLERTVAAPVRVRSSQLRGPVLFVFPSLYKSYGLEISQTVADAIGECSTATELDIRITDVELTDDRTPSVLIHVEPVELRVYDGNEVIARGAPKLIE